MTSIVSRFTLNLLLLTALAGRLAADDLKSAAPITTGQSVFTCGHSFHYFMPPILAELAKAAKIQGHEQVGQSSIGGSRIIQHWDVADEKNKAKELLKAGKVDALTLSPAQEDLFTDPLGHVKGHVMALNAYCHFAVIYRKTPVALPAPAVLKTAKLGDDETRKRSRGRRTRLRWLHAPRTPFNLGRLTPNLTCRGGRCG